MRTIKTRNAVKNVKVLDKGVNLSKHMRDAYVRTKDKAEETQNAHHASPADYAGDSIQNAVHDSVCYPKNPQHKASENWNRAKGHFQEVKHNMPKERQRAAEQAQKTANKAKSNAKNLRKTADKAGETAQEAKTAVKDAKQTLKEVRQHGRQTLREVKQSARFEPNNNGFTLKDKMLHSHYGKLKNQAKGEYPKQSGSTPINAPTIVADSTPKGGLHRPNYLNKAITVPKNMLDTAKPLQTAAKASGNAVKSTNKGFKETAKGTVKTVKKSVKTAEQSAKAAVKTAQQSAKMAQRTARTAAKTAKAAEHAARTAAKTAVHTAKAAARAVAAMVKMAIAAVKGLVAAIAAGGSTLVIVIVIIILVAALFASPFGMFFSDQDTSADTTRISQVVQETTAEFYADIESVKQAHSYVDSVVMHYVGCSGGIQIENWIDVLAVFAVKTALDNDGMDVVTIDLTRINLIRSVFFDMNKITYYVEEIYHEAEDEDDEDWTEYILHITVTSKSASQQASEYHFTADQTDLLNEMLKPEYNQYFVMLISGIGGIGGDIGVISVGIYIWPSATCDTITSYFGSRINPVTGEADNHTGIDIAAGYGTAILAAADGTVITSSFNDGGYGNYVVINHGGGNRTLYGHMSRRNVSAGEAVTQGQIIGFVGSTGMSTGPHLHFETLVNGTRVDPLLYYSGY